MTKYNCNCLYLPVDMLTLLRRFAQGYNRHGRHRLGATSDHKPCTLSVLSSIISQTKYHIGFDLNYKSLLPFPQININLVIASAGHLPAI